MVTVYKCKTGSSCEFLATPKITLLSGALILLEICAENSHMCIFFANSENRGFSEYLSHTPFKINNQQFLTSRVFTRDNSLASMLWWNEKKRSHTESSLQIVLVTHGRTRAGVASMSVFCTLEFRSHTRRAFLYFSCNIKGLETGFFGRKYDEKMGEKSIQADRKKNVRWGSMAGDFMESFFSLIAIILFCSTFLPPKIYKLICPPSVTSPGSEDASTSMSQFHGF